MNAAYVTSIGIALPKYKFKQENIALFMQNRLKLSKEASRKLKILYRLSAIHYRYSVLPDYDLSNEPVLYKTEEQEFPSTSERMSIYQKEALSLAKKAAFNCLKERRINKKQITHLITVSCTGMYAPGIDIELIQTLELSSNVHRTCVNFMGCYASMNALKIAQSICEANKEAKVLIVSVELCTLHLQKSDKEDDLLANTLFADGAGAVLVEADAQNNNALLLERFYCDLALEGQADMSWHIHDTGFLMRLSSYVPDLVSKSVQKLFSNLLNNTPLSINEIEGFALHPGGKRILELIANGLNLSPEKLQPSFDVLANYGNMSSASILFVLKLWWEKLKNQPQSINIMALALGPGLTLESALLKFIPAKPLKKQSNPSLTKIEA